MEEYIYINDNSFSKEICNDIIDMFENQEDKCDGVTFGGLDKNVKDTIDFRIPIDESNPHFIKWQKIRDLLKNELTRNLNIYIKKISEPLLLDIQNSTRKYQFFNHTSNCDTYMIQKYNKNKGRYIYHDDAHIEWNTKRYRILTYIWYLNDVYDGGETEFFGKLRIVPRAGKLVLFPSTWCYPHRGRVPISDNKYIITGWIYISDL